jgi:hypothetical protein
VAARLAFSSGPELRVDLLHRGLEICAAFSVGGAIFLRSELSRIGDSCHFPLYDTAMAGGRRSQERERARKIRSFESGWIFSFLRFELGLDRFLWNESHRSCVPDAFLCFLSSGTESFAIPVKILRSRRGLKEKGDESSNKVQL